ncbi:hypothetical protein THAOC_03190, partial [Thalassiosira oceanica]
KSARQQYEFPQESVDDGDCSSDSSDPRFDSNDSSDSTWFQTNSVVQAFTLGYPARRGNSLVAIASLQQSSTSTSTGDISVRYVAPQQVMRDDGDSRMSDLPIPSDVGMRDSDDSASGQDSVSVAVEVQESLLGMDALWPGNIPLDCKTFFQRWSLSPPDGLWDGTTKREDPISKELLGARRRHIETNLSDSYMDGGGLHLAVVVGFENIGLDPGNEMIAVMSEPDHVESAEAHTFMDNFGCVQYLLDADSAFVAYRLQDGEIFSVLGDNTVPTWFRPELINVYGDGESTFMIISHEFSLIGLGQKGFGLQDRSSRLTIGRIAVTDLRRAARRAPRGAPRRAPRARQHSSMSQLIERVISVTQFRQSILDRLLQEGYNGDIEDDLVSDVSGQSILDRSLQEGYNGDIEDDLVSDVSDDDVGEDDDRGNRDNRDSAAIPFVSPEDSHKRRRLRSSARDCMANDAVDDDESATLSENAQSGIAQAWEAQGQDADPLLGIHPEELAINNSLRTYSQEEERRNRDTEG